MSIFVYDQPSPFIYLTHQPYIVLVLDYFRTRYWLGETTRDLHRDLQICQRLLEPLKLSRPWGKVFFSPNLVLPCCVNCFFCCCNKTPGPKAAMEKLTLAYVSTGVREAWEQDQEVKRSHFHPYAGRREWTGCKVRLWVFKALLQWHASSSKATTLKGSHNSPKQCPRLGTECLNPKCMGQIS